MAFKVAGNDGKMEKKQVVTYNTPHQRFPRHGRQSQLDRLWYHPVSLHDRRPCTSHTTAKPHTRETRESDGMRDVDETYRRGCTTRAGSPRQRAAPSPRTAPSPICLCHPLAPHHCRLSWEQLSHSSNRLMKSGQPQDRRTWVGWAD